MGKTRSFLIAYLSTEGARDRVARDGLAIKASWYYAKLWAQALQLEDVKQQFCLLVISVDSDPRRENPPHLLQTPEPISGWHRHTSITPVTPINS